MKEKFYNAYVTVTLAVGLAFDRKPSKKQLRKAALENFQCHPAIRDLGVDDLDAHVDKIEIEPAETLTCRAQLRYGTPPKGAIVIV